jgi:hypothetical protein
MAKGGVAGLEKSLFQKSICKNPLGMAELCLLPPLSCTSLAGQRQAPQPDQDNNNL